VYRSGMAARHVILWSMHVALHASAHFGAPLAGSPPLSRNPSFASSCCSFSSAKNSINIEEAFSMITRDVKQRLLDGGSSGTSSYERGVNLMDKGTSGAKKVTGCC